MDSSGNATSYTTAFPNAEDNMGCGESAVSISSNDTGNPTCSGYELAADLDFDTDGSGGPNSGDTYWNSGAGWTPIGDATTGYTGDFDGNRANYEISNLFINSSTSTAGAYAGLFGVLGAGAAVKEVLLVGASVTATGTSSDSAHTVYAGALAGKNGGTVTDSRSLGTVAVVRTPSSTGYGYAGGLVGWNDGTVRASYSRAAVTATANKGAEGHAGGLVGLNDTGSTVAASFATGDVTATTTDTGTLLNSPHTGGLVSMNKGSVIASYAHGAGTVKGRNVVRGGLVAVNDTGGTITASYSTGGHTGTGTNSTASGGLAGTQNGTVTASYWDTDTSSIADDADTNPPEGKTTSALQTPTAYGTGNAIYANWNVNVDGVAGNDSPWNFGTSSQYPVLVHGGLTAADQRAAVTVALSPTSICESSKGSHANACGASPATTSTLTATITPAQEVPVTLAFNTNAAVYTLKVGNTAASQITIASGSTSGTITVEAVNNKTDASDLSVTLTPTASGRVWISMPAGATLTIKDEDILTKPAGVKVSVDGTKAQVDWTAVTDATGYTVQWSTSATFAGSPSSGTSTTTSHKITSGLNSGTKYYFRVIANKTGYDDSVPSDSVSATPTTGDTDYDADNDGLIEITTLAQLNAVRWDLDGDGEADNSGNATAYATAFADAEDNMGCNESAVTIASNDTGNAPCSGYELDADLDFDTDGSGGPNSGDTYWNSGAGWTPIGDGTNPFATTFDGQGPTYKISNLYVNASTTADDADADLGGLFGVIGKDGEVENLGLEGVSVTVSSTQENEVYAGAVAGDNQGTVTGSWSSGSVTASTDKNGAADAYAGGLVGRNDKGGSGANAYTGVIRASYSRASVTARGRTQSPGNADGTEAAAGGLAGRNNGTITTGFSTGDATATRYSSTGTYPWRAIAGGLVGINNGTVTAAYADADTDSTSYTTGSSSAAAIAGGLVGENLSGATVTASYSTGAPTTAGHTSPDEGGLVGSNGGTVTDGYWDTTTSGVSTAGAGTGKTTAEIKAPHRLRNRRQRHLQGLERERGRRVGRRRPVELRNGRPVSDPQVQRAEQRHPAGRRHAVVQPGHDL